MVLQLAFYCFNLFQWQVTSFQKMGTAHCSAADDAEVFEINLLVEVAVNQKTLAALIS